MPTTKTESNTWIKIITAFFILKILNKGSAHGNKIAEEIKQMTGHTLSPNPNFLYPLLRKLEESGYVIGNWENLNTRGKRIYTITEAGAVYLLDIKERVQTKFLDKERKMNIIRKHLFE